MVNCNNMKKYLLVFLASVLAWSLNAGNTKHVNMFLGSEGDNGQMTPGATVPFGMISVCPDSRPNQHGGYDYAVPEISGVSINRISGVGCYGTGGNISVRPGLPSEEIKIVKGTEKASPGYYETLFSNGVKGRLTATRSVAVERYSFARKNGNQMFIDFLSSFASKRSDCEFSVTDPRVIDGWIVSGTACDRGQYKLWFRLSCDKPFTVNETTKGTALLSFDSDEVEVRIAVSPVDQMSAAQELSDCSGKSFAELKKAAERQWNEKLGKITVSGGAPDQKILFYTSLYRVYLSPMDVTSPDGRFKGTDGKIYTLKEGEKHYSSWSMWDTFRTKFPMLELLEKTAMTDIANSIVDLYRTGKKNWATNEESCPTVRTEHSVITLLDAFNKGIEGIRLQEGYAGMVSEAERDLPRKSADNKMESSYDLWALSRISAALGHKDEAEDYADKSLEMFETIWKSEFMTITPEFNLMEDAGMYEGSRWQYRWAAPEYLDKMIELKGKETLASELDEFFSKGLFNQGNEPDIHTPFIFNRLGQPLKSQSVVRDLLTKEDMVHRFGGHQPYPQPFVGRAFQNKTNGLAPEMDEDDGTMSAWYMFSQMGFYPLVVGTDSYELVSPLFNRITIRSEGCKTVITTRGRKTADDPVKTVFVDGKALDGFSLPHSVFLKNSKITFQY